MSWLWQGIAITVAGGLILALLSWVIKMIHEYVKAKPKREQAKRQKIKIIEDALLAKRNSYRSATAFYKEFDDGSWLSSFTLPVQINGKLGKILKKKWLQNADLTVSYDSSNVQFMRFSLIAKHLGKSDLETLLDLPIKDKYGNYQAAGKLSFMKFMQVNYRQKVSDKIVGWIKGYEEHEQM